MAHRNLSSKNIYVTNHLQCCIGGFSHAVVMAPSNANTTSGFGDLEVKTNPRMPSYRYMAPEILQDLSTFDLHDIDDFQKGDVYAFGLILWELILRYEVKGESYWHVLHVFFSFFKHNTYIRAQIC